MKFCSTRGGERGLNLSEVVVVGYAKDGGLFVPESIPRLTASQWLSWKALPYPELSAEIFNLFDSDGILGSLDESKRLFSEAYKKAFCEEDVVTLKELCDDVFVAELFHGPTLAFKDLALTGLATIIDALLEKRRSRCIALVATSGDTGSAAGAAVSRMKHADIVVLFPKGRVTRTQELQMTTLSSSNVHVIEGEGDSDELDEPLKILTSDGEFQQEYNLAIFNSINVLRILLQIPYYFYLYFRVLEKSFAPGLEIDSGDLPELVFVVPTGAAGNLAGGSFAKAMGLPVKFVPCSNENAAVYDLIETATLKKPRTPTRKTLANAMDIQVPYNFERVLYAASGCDTSILRDLLTKYDSNGSVELPDDMKANLDALIADNYRATDRDISAAMRWCRDTYGYAVCPHTAAGIAYAKTKKLLLGEPSGERIRMVCIATASPAKFPEAFQAVGLDPPLHPVIESLQKIPTCNKVSMTRSVDWVEFLKDFIRSRIPAHPDNGLIDLSDE